MTKMKDSMTRIEDFTFKLIITILAIAAMLCCSLAILVILLKKSRTVLDEVLGHTFINHILFDAFFLPWFYLDDLYKDWTVLIFICVMFAFNGLAFLTMTGVQQFIAVFFPLKLRMWVTTSKTRFTLGATYVANFLLQGSLYIINKWFQNTEANKVTYANPLIVLILVFSMILMYMAMFYKFFIRACFKRNAPVIEGSQTHGEFHDKKTVCMLFVITLGSELTMVAHFLNTSQRLFGLNMTAARLGPMFIMFQWILAPCVYIAMNFKTWNSIFRKQQTPNVQNTLNNLP